MTNIGYFLFAPFRGEYARGKAAYSAIFGLLKKLMETFIPHIAATLRLPAQAVRNTLELLEAGATIPFLARYRKEATGSLDEVQLAEIQQEGKRLAELEKRREAILRSIAEQGGLTDVLEAQILACTHVTDLEDLYLPFRRKKKTKAGMAREKGLEPLAQSIFQQDGQIVPAQLALEFINDQVPDLESALQGARDIMAEIISEDISGRNALRQLYGRTAVVHSKLVRGKVDEGKKYQDYHDFSEPLAKCPSHRMLALRRGEDEGILRVWIGPADEELAIIDLERIHLKKPSPAREEVRQAIRDAWERLLSPSLETEYRQLSKEKADADAIGVFSENLKQLLLTAPLGEKVVMGIDPGFRTGCKVVILSEAGDLLESTAVYPHPPQQDAENASRTLLHLIEKHAVTALAIGNGTAGRETIAFCRSLSQSHPFSLFSVNEAGASIYSASEIAREEFPNQDITVRGAVSIGRRLMDPLAELVKIDPKSLGVGQYQHDVQQTRLRESLDNVVIHCVNCVGVNLNTASRHLLSYVSGLGPALAGHIVTYRMENGPFSSRNDLKKVPRMGEKAFEQAAGFLRIRNGSSPLDKTAVHPESYHVVGKMAKDLGCTVEELINQPKLRGQIQLDRYVSDNTGLPTLKDILVELAKPGLDPRGEAKPFSFDEGVRTMEDLRVGMVLKGIVNNITHFGAFVDIGLKESGLIHVSQMADRFIQNPATVVKLQQEVQVRVTDIDTERRRIQLSMKGI